MALAVDSVLHPLHIRHLCPRHIPYSRGRRLAQPPALLPSPPAFGIVFLVRRQVERDEQKKIGAQYSYSGKRGKFLTRAFTRCRQAREIGAAEVGIGGEVDEAKIDHELCNLQARDPFLPPNPNAARGLKVVPVHDNMDSQIESYRHPGDGGEANKLGVTQESGGTVVVGVEKSWVSD